MHQQEALQSSIVQVGEPRGVTNNPELLEELADS